MNEIRTIAVAGAGTMGRGIAQTIAQAGFSTWLFDLNQHAIAEAQTQITNNLHQLLERKKLDQASLESILGRLQFTNDLNDCRCDLLIEAVVENLEVKQQLFRQFATLNGDQCILASNTSSLSVTHIAEVIPSPERVAGLHFFNPAPVMKLVELVRTPATSEAVIQRLKTFIADLGKVAVTCIDAPGFIVNHVARPYYIEALRLMEQGVEMEQIDALMEASGFRMGPFRLMDLIGNDINYAVSKSVYEALGNPPRLMPSQVQKELVDNGRLGLKTGSGFYRY